MRYLPKWKWSGNEFVEENIDFRLSLIFWTNKIILLIHFDRMEFWPDIFENGNCIECFIIQNEIQCKETTLIQFFESNYLILDHHCLKFFNIKKANFALELQSVGFPKIVL